MCCLGGHSLEFELDGLVVRVSVGWDVTDEEALAPGETKSLPFVPGLGYGAYLSGWHCG